MPARGPSRPLRQMAPPLSGGRRPLTHSFRTEVVSEPAPHRGCPPHGFWATRRSGVDCVDGPALAVGKQSLWVASPGVLSQPPFSTDRSLGRRPSGYSLTAWYSQLHLFTAQVEAALPGQGRYFLTLSKPSRSRCLSVRCCQRTHHTSHRVPSARGFLPIFEQIMLRKRWRFKCARTSPVRNDSATTHLMSTQLG